MASEGKILLPPPSIYLFVTFLVILKIIAYAHTGPNHAMPDFHNVSPTLGSALASQLVNVLVS